MEWGTPVRWGRFLLFCAPQSVKTKETNPTRPASPTPCKQALSLKAHAWVMSSLPARSPGVLGATVQPESPGRAFSNAWAKRKRKWAKHVWLMGKKKSRLQNSQFFSQNRCSLTLTRARRASLTRPSFSRLALSFHPRFSFDCSRVLDFAKIRTVLQSRKSPSINQSINKIKYLFILDFVNIGRVTATAVQRSPTPWFKNNLNLPVTRQFIDSYPNG